MQQLPKLYLCRDVYTCTCDGATVILDVRADRYQRLSPRQGAWLEALVSGTPRCTADPALLKFSRHLVERGILTAEASRARTQNTSRAAEPNPSRDGPWRERMAPDPGDLAPMIRAFLRCLWIERTGVFSGQVDACRSWRRTGPARQPAAEDEVRRLAARFHALTPFFFDTQDACRFRSFCLIRFLSLHGIPSDWVFGVRTSPFGAHCWVEWQGIVLNDHADTVGEYVPIMTV